MMYPFTPFDITLIGVAVTSFSPEKSFRSTLQTDPLVIIPVAGTKCSTSGSDGFSPTKCSPGGLCVLTDFGYPAVDLPNQGICREVPVIVPNCSVAFCARKGLYDVWQISGQTTFCFAWPIHEDFGRTPKCPGNCKRDCMSGKFRASDGSLYWNPYDLITTSCKPNFTSYGPVLAPKTCFDPI